MNSTVKNLVAKSSTSTSVIKIMIQNRFSWVFVFWESLHHHHQITINSVYEKNYSLSHHQNLTTPLHEEIHAAVLYTQTTNIEHVVTIMFKYIDINVYNISPLFSFILHNTIHPCLSYSCICNMQQC